MSLYDSLIKEGEVRGFQKSIEQGVEQGIVKTILNAYTNGFDLESIRLITGESIEKIKEVIAKAKS